MRLFCVISLVVLLSCKESTSVNHIGPLASVTMGGENACGLTPDGVAYCWGINATGGVRDGPRPPPPVPLPPARHPPLPTTPRNPPPASRRWPLIQPYLSRLHT